MSKLHYLEDGRHVHNVRQSLLNSAAICPERARLIWTGEMPSDASDSAAIGTAVHAAIDDHLKMGSTFERGLDVALDAFYDAQREPNFKWVKYSGNTAVKMIEMFYSRWYEMFMPVHRGGVGWELERYFQVPLHEDDERVITMSGTVDAYDGFRLYDWKTSGRGAYEEREYQRWALQPTCYAYAMWVQTGHIPEFEYVVMHADGLQRFTVHRDERDFEWLKDVALSYAVLAEKELPVWPKQDNTWLCSNKYCPAWDQCKGKHYADAS